MAMKQKLVVLTGAGISAESGLKTFRDSDGLWENYNVYDVATPEAWRKNPALVQEFYNARRRQVLEVAPNKAHHILAELEARFDIHIITQNIDNLHERAGSKKVLHLHGEITKARSTVNSSLVYDINGWELKMGDKCEKGSQLRPHIVWFGEEVPMLSAASMITQTADLLLIVGTSLNVYPAAGLVNYVPMDTPIYVVDPGEIPVRHLRNVTFIKEKATIGMEKFKGILKLD